MSRHATITSASSATVSVLRVAVAAAAALALFASRAEAQGLPTRHAVEVRPVVGALLPTGDQRDLLDEAVLVGAQASYALTPNLAVIGTVGWSPSKDRLLGGEKLDLFQYDVGLEGRLNNLTPASRIVTRPYAALGVGGRTYDYRDLDGADAETNFLGFGALGLDLAQASGPLGLRLEVRDNVTAFKGLRGELDDREARNDLQLSAGLTFAF